MRERERESSKREALIGAEGDKKEKDSWPPGEASGDPERGE